MLFVVIFVCAVVIRVITCDMSCVLCILPFFYRPSYVTVLNCYTTKQFYLPFLVLFHSAAYANPCPSFGLFTLYRRRLCTVLTFNSSHFTGLFTPYWYILGLLWI